MELFTNLADITQSDFILMLIKLSAYIIPFFLIPAAFKAGMGAFSAITGMMSDRSRGFFDKQRKKRQGIYDTNKARMKAGERFNNRGLNALTSRASTSRFGLTGKGRAAYQQKINNSGNEFAKSAQAQGVQHNDDALAAMTYGSAAEAHSMLTRSIADGGFGFDAGRARSAVAAAQASGGFGRNRQVWAAAQLARTGTGYENIEQVAKTIARVSHGNEGQAAALAGDINASTKQVARNDLAPGFGTLNTLARAEMGRGGPAPTQDDYHIATRDAWNSGDINTMVRNKGPGMEAFATSFESVLANPNATAIDKRDAAIALAEMHASLPGATAGNQQYINDTLNQVLGPNWDDGRPIETQLSAVLAAQGVTTTATEINQRARKYGSSVPPGAQGAGGQPPAGPTPPPAAPPSDRQLKKDIRLLDTLPGGIRIYSFRYFWDDQQYVGVMAQDLLESHPDAVITGPDGYYRVNYTMLGIRMLTYEQWQEDHTLLFNTNISLEVPLA